MCFWAIYGQSRSFPIKVPNTDLKCKDLIVWKVIVYYSLYVSSLEYFEYVKGKLIP